MDIPWRTPANTAIVLIDYAVGFANLFRSHTVSDNVNGAVALARTAQIYDVPLIVTHGRDTDGPGPIYPQLAEVLGDHPIVRRGGEFDSFDDPSFVAAVEATGRRHLVLGGLMTEGCVLFTTLGALRRGYTASVVVDASAGQTLEAHDTAVARLTQLDVTPVTWLTQATEFQRGWNNHATVPQYIDLLVNYAPPLGMSILAKQPATG